MEYGLGVEVQTCPTPGSSPNSRLKSQLQERMGTPGLRFLKYNEIKIYSKRSERPL
jgi:hypothetical protein